MDAERSMSILQRCMLAHLEAQVVADSVGVRILHFKGPFSRHDFPDRGGSHTDADILVEAGAVPRLTQALQSRGWELYNENEEGLRGHGQVLHKEGRTCTIDLHHYYPGLRKGWKENFDLLYAAARQWPELTSHPLRVPGVADHAILMILDTLSDRLSTDVQRRRRHKAVMDALTDADQTAMAARSKDLGVAELVLAPTDVNDADRSRVRRRMLMEMQHDTTYRGSAVWLQRFQDSPGVVKKARVAWLALVSLPPEENPPAYPVRLIRHWGRGLTQLLEIRRRLTNTPPPSNPATTVDVSTPPSSTVAEAEISPTSPSVENTAPQAPAAPEPPRCAPTGAGLITDHCVWYAVDEATVAALHLSTGDYVVCEGAGAQLWLEMADATSLDEAIGRTLSCFAEPPANAQEQLEAFARDLATQGLATLPN